MELHWFLPATLVPPGLNLEDCTQAKRSRKTVADVSTWLLCFNRYVVAMCSVYPGMLHQMLAYSNIIIQAQLQFNGDGWLTYDRMFCIAAATSRNTNWRNVDASLYAHFVSCQPRRGGVCQLCCSTAHRSTACPWGVDEPAPPEQPSAVQTPWYPRSMHPWYSGPPSSLQCLQFAPHGMRATVASEGAATIATSVPFASSRATATRSVPHLPQVPGARLGGPCIPVHWSQAGPVQPLSHIPSRQDYVSRLGYSIGDGMCAAGRHGMLTPMTG